MQMKQPHQKLHLPLHANLAVSSVSDSTDMFEPTFTSNTETEVQFVPGTVNLNVAVDWRTTYRMMLDPRDILRGSIESAVGQKIDQDVFTKLATFTTNKQGDTGSDLTLANILGARSQIKAGAKQYLKRGTTLYFWYHHLQ